MRKILTSIFKGALLSAMIAAMIGIFWNGLYIFVFEISHWMNISRNTVIIAMAVFAVLASICYYCSGKEKDDTKK